MLSWTYLVAAVLVTGAWTLVWVMNMPAKVGWLATGIIAVPLVIGVVRWAIDFARTRRRAPSTPDGERGDGPLYTGLDKLAELPVAGIEPSELPRMPRYVVLGSTATGTSTLLDSSRVVFHYSIPGAELRWWIGGGLVLAVVPAEPVTDPPWSTTTDPAVQRDLGLAGIADGIVVTVSVDELWDRSKVEIIAHAEAMRARLNAMVGPAQPPMPVYLVITKLDLLPGFRQAFGGDDARTRAMPWGLSLDGDPSRELDTLSASLEAFVASRLQSVSDDPGRRATLLLLPRCFEALGTSIQWYLEGLTERGLYSAKLRFRTAYFTSATQSGHTVARDTKGFGAPSSSPLARDEAPGAYFIEDFVAKILPQDPQAIANARRRRVDPRGLISVVVSATVAALALVLAGWQGAHSIRLQRELCEVTRAMRDTAGGRASPAICALREEWRDDGDADLARIADRLDELCERSP